MRHRKAVTKLGRTASHRKATLANLCSALFERKHIQTTEAKAKAARSVSERLITLAKKDTLHARRLAFKQLGQKRIVKILFDDVAPEYADRPGGYTRVVKLGQRSGDGARMAILELVGFEVAKKKKKEKDKAQEAKDDSKKKKKKAKEEPAVEEAPAQEKEKEEKKAKSSKKKTDKKEVAKESKKKDDKPEDDASE